ncbi:anoctamin-6 [Eurytemora carolleeae]|uniref:anoctamin-6 n=1 Tax=Eurytemora carolleeae TaxID=1294199 RepID=UPI000C795117|nr:anoctamin-6 [Eurytemora carolleeae]|eukprot:XP_023344945.1 anoctamin-6-like [Eurytemora affinis]
MSRLFVRKKQREKYELKTKDNFQPLEESTSSPVHSVHNVHSSLSTQGVQLGVNGTNSSYGSITSLLNNEQLAEDKWEVRYTLKDVFNQSNPTTPHNLTALRGKDDISTYFNDKIRKIDFVLVYEEDKKDSIDNPGFMFDVENQEGVVNNGGAPTPSPTHHRKIGKKKQKFRLWRQKFISGLQSIGLDIESDVVAQCKNNLHFLKIHAPWSLICRYAEELNLRAPLQAHPNPSMNWSEWILQKLRLPNPMFENVPNRPLDYYTCPFKTTKLDSYRQFLGSDDLGSFFSRAQRSRIVYEILSTTAFGREKKGEINLGTIYYRLIWEQSITDKSGYNPL